MAKRSKYPTVTLLELGSLRVTLLNGKKDWQEYLVWQLGLLAASASLLAVLLLLWRPEMVTDVAALQVLLAALPGVIMSSVALWWLIKRDYSRSKRFALAFFILAMLSASLVTLAVFNAVSDVVWFKPVLAATLLYLFGTGVIGLIIFFRGDNVSPWWKR